MYAASSIHSIGDAMSVTYPHEISDFFEVILAISKGFLIFGFASLNSNVDREINRTYYILEMSLFSQKFSGMKSDQIL